jgi:uncharacterized damage-inducible protein DinB
MYRTVEDFVAQWTNESAATRKIMNALTDASLDQRIAPNHRTLGQLAWHLVTSMHEMLSRVGLDFDAPAEHDPVPLSAAAIAEAYRSTSAAMLEAVRDSWTDQTLAETKDMYGEQWPNGLTLQILLLHEIHHRAQMTVLMRQAGLRVPGLYGPSREDWLEMGAQPPAV